MDGMRPRRPAATSPIDGFVPRQPRQSPYSQAQSMSQPRIGIQQQLPAAPAAPVPFNRSQSPHNSLPISPDPAPLPDTAPTSLRRKVPKMWLAIVSLLLVVMASVIAGYFWYSAQLQPVNAADTVRRSVVVQTGATADEIGTLLVEKGLIRNKLAYTIYTRLHNARSTLQTGEYRIAPNESMSEVIAHITAGKSDTFSLTLYPGATLYDPTATADAKRTDAYTMLRRAGYGDSEIRTAFAKQYEGTIFAGKPTGSSLEGYVYGETYQFNTGASVEQVLKRTFDEYEKAIKDSGIEAAAKQRGMSLYQAITLASIIHGEVRDPEEQRQVAQVFYRRLEQGIPLGSDVTFYYAAQQQNQPVVADFPSPYNTRLHAGLPPGPVSTPGLSALKAVASPAPGDYLYFVSGDDGRTHFSKTLEEHNRLTAQYCTKLCY